jgi:hypothetical protein
MHLKDGPTISHYKTVAGIDLQSTQFTVTNSTHYPELNGTTFDLTKGECFEII